MKTLKKFLNSKRSTMHDAVVTKVINFDQSIIYQLNFKMKKKMVID